LLSMGSHKTGSAERSPAELPRLLTAHATKCSLISAVRPPCDSTRAPKRVHVAQPGTSWNSTTTEGPSRDASRDASPHSPRNLTTSLPSSGAGAAAAALSCAGAGASLTLLEFSSLAGLRCANVLNILAMEAPRRLADLRPPRGRAHSLHRASASYAGAGVAESATPCQRRQATASWPRLVRPARAAEPRGRVANGRAPSRRRHAGHGRHQAARDRTSSELGSTPEDSSVPNPRRASDPPQSKTLTRQGRRAVRARAARSGGRGKACHSAATQQDAGERPGPMDKSKGKEGGK
jgi:hypothetical protein